jgi:hypothetical protein
MSNPSAARWRRLFPPVEELTDVRIQGIIDQAYTVSRLEWSAREKAAWQERTRRIKEGRWSG